MAREWTHHEDGFLKGKRYLIMDRYAKFCESTRTFLSKEDVEPVRLPPRSPYMNSLPERFFRSLKSECLDRRILFGEKALRCSPSVSCSRSRRAITPGVGQQVDCAIGTPAGCRRQNRKDRTTRRSSSLLSQSSLKNRRSICWTSHPVTTAGSVAAAHSTEWGANLDQRKTENALWK